MTLTPTGKLIHLCIDNFQEKNLSQKCNEVAAIKIDLPSIGTNQKSKVKNKIPRSSGRSQRLFLHFLPLYEPIPFRRGMLDP